MDKVQTLDRFWNGFGLKAYDENSVPDKTPFPYITYEVSTDTFGNTVAQTASVWYRSSSWSEITEKVQDIENFITRGGRMLSYDGGAMWVQKDTPWAQRMGDSSDEMIRRIVLNITIEYLD